MATLDELLEIAWGDDYEHPDRDYACDIGCYIIGSGFIYKDEFYQDESARMLLEKLLPEADKKGLKIVDVTPAIELENLDYTPHIDLA